MSRAQRAEVSRAVIARARRVVRARRRPTRTMSATSMTQRASFATSSVSAARAMPKSASSRGALVVRGAASKAKKQGQLDALAAMANAEETFLVAGFNYQSLSVRIEDDAIVFVCVWRGCARARARVGRAVMARLGRRRRVHGGARIALRLRRDEGRVCARARVVSRQTRCARGEDLCARVGARAGAMGAARARDVGVIRCARVVEGFRVSQGAAGETSRRGARFLSMNDVTDDVCDAFDFVVNRLRI